MLLGQWLLEQGVWAAPVAACPLWWSWSKPHRGRVLNLLMLVLTGVFVANLVGCFPARTSCDFVAEFPPACVKTGIASSGNEYRSRSVVLGNDGHVTLVGTVGVVTSLARLRSARAFPFGPGGCRRRSSAWPRPADASEVFPGGIAGDRAATRGWAGPSADGGRSCYPVSLGPDGFPDGRTGAPDRGRAVLAGAALTHTSASARLPQFTRAFAEVLGGGSP
jgi:hypothetical protein